MGTRIKIFGFLIVLELIGLLCVGSFDYRPSGSYYRPPGSYYGSQGRYCGPSGRYYRPSGSYYGPPGRYYGPSGRYYGPSGSCASGQTQQRDLVSTYRSDPGITLMDMHSPYSNSNNVSKIGRGNVDGFGRVDRSDSGKQYQSRCRGTFFLNKTRNEELHILENKGRRSRTTLPFDVTYTSYTAQLSDNESFTWYTLGLRAGLSYNITDLIKKKENSPKTCRSYTLVTIVCTVVITLLFCLIIVGAIYKNRWRVRYCLYRNRRRFFRCQATRDIESGENYIYDAFISYAEENTWFILDGIIPNLEEKGIKLCIDQRDFILGKAITDNVINAIKSSKKTVVILTRAFLKNEWCLYEFQTARMEGLYSRDGNSSVVIVMLENVPPDKSMPLEMMELIKQGAYIEYTDNVKGKMLFWEKLDRAIV